MDEATGEEDFPRMPVPIPETQSRVKPGPATYSTKKTAIEDILLGQREVPVTVLRPCAIYGPGDTQCREWFFVKRALDRRSFMLLADEGQSVFHTNSVHNLAEMVRLAAERPVHGAFNCGDPDPPDVQRIARRIAETLEHEWEQILLPRGISRDFGNPWGGAHPWLVSTEKAEQVLGYRPVTTHEVAIVETVEWIVHATRNQDWRKVFAQAAGYLGEKFDYQGEDRFLATLAR